MARGVGQRVGIEAGVVGQRMVFEIAPGVFDGIEFRGIRRQQDRVDGAGVGHEPLDEPGTMGLEPIPVEDHRVGGWRRWRSWRKNATTTAGGGTCLCFNWLQLIWHIADPQMLLKSLN